MFFFFYFAFGEMKRMSNLISIRTTNIHTKFSEMSQCPHVGVFGFADNDLVLVSVASQSSIKMGFIELMDILSRISVFNAMRYDEFTSPCVIYTF